MKRHSYRVLRHAVYSTMWYHQVYLSQMYYGLAYDREEAGKERTLGDDAKLLEDNKPNGTYLTLKDNACLVTDGELTEY
jgi:hypothetical protein